MAKEYKTQKHGTYTAEGWIPHRRHPLSGVVMPVKVRVTPEKITADFPVAIRRNGALVFVLPTGGEFLDH